MFLLHSCSRICTPFFTLIRGCFVLFCSVLFWVLFLFLNARSSVFRVGWQVEFNQFVTVVVNEVKHVFLMLCCHFHSCIFVFM